MVLATVNTAVHRAVRFAGSSDDDTHDGSVNVWDGGGDDDFHVEGGGDDEFDVVGGGDDEFDVEGGGDVDGDDVEDGSDVDGDDVVADDELQADSIAKSSDDGTVVLWLAAARDDEKHKILTTTTDANADTNLELDFILLFFEKTLFQQ